MKKYLYAIVFVCTHSLIFTASTLASRDFQAYLNEDATSGSEYQVEGTVDRAEVTGQAIIGEINGTTLQLNIRLDKFQLLLSLPMSLNEDITLSDNNGELTIEGFGDRQVCENNQNNIDSGSLICNFEEGQVVVSRTNRSEFQVKVFGEYLENRIKDELPEQWPSSIKKQLAPDNAILNFKAR